MTRLMASAVVVQPNALFRVVMAMTVVARDDDFEALLIFLGETAVLAGVMKRRR